jgi:hypothetical protein
MKNSNDHPQQSTVVDHRVCNETKCATCFQNRGCIYEQYFHVTVQNMEIFIFGNQIKVPNPAIGVQ